METQCHCYCTSLNLILFLNTAAILLIYYDIKFNKPSFIQGFIVRTLSDLIKENKFNIGDVVKAFLSSSKNEEKEPDPAKPTTVKKFIRRAVTSPTLETTSNVTFVEDVCSDKQE